MHITSMELEMRQLIFLTVAALLLAGCGATTLIPGAERVRLTRDEPKECEYLGEVVGNQGGALTGPMTSNADLEQGAINDMKNRAFKMGGNVVYIISNRAGETGNYNRDSGGSQQTNVVYVGSVYRCAESR